MVFALRSVVVVMLDDCSNIVLEATGKGAIAGVRGFNRYGCCRCQAPRCS